MFSFHYSAVKAIDKAVEPFQNIQELLKSAIFLKQQLKVEETKRRPNTANNQNSSVYKRLSGECALLIELFKFIETDANWPITKLRFK